LWNHAFIPEGNPMTTRWQVTLIWNGAGDDETDWTHQRALTISLGDDYSAVASVRADGCFLVMSITASTAVTALNQAVSLTNVHRKTLGLPTAEYLEMTVLTQEEGGRRARVGLVPELWSRPQAAEFLGVSPERVRQLAEAYPDSFVVAARTGKSGKPGVEFYLASIIREFAEAERGPGTRTKRKNEVVAGPASPHRSGSVSWGS
jgi:hypothetical protein